jgi:hypothetical protein
MATGMLISQLIMAVDRQYNCLLIPCHDTVYTLNDGFKTCVDEWTNGGISHAAVAFMASLLQDASRRVARKLL